MTMRSYLDFEKPVAELEAKVEELRQLGQKGKLAQAEAGRVRRETKTNNAITESWHSSLHDTHTRTHSANQRKGTPGGNSSSS